WHKLPRPLALLNLRAFRDELRERNLYDTGPGEDAGSAGNGGPEELPKYRTYDGAMNDPRHPEMGKANIRFGRNHPLGATVPEQPPKLMTPNPRTVSTSLLNRDTFKPATTLNVLAAAWIQFQNHDWFSHGDNSPDESVVVALEPGDEWGEAEMKVRSTTRDREGKSTYVNTVTHWWDGSQIYGSSEEQNRPRRTGEDGKLILQDGRLPEEDREGLQGIDQTGFN